MQNLCRNKVLLTFWERLEKTADWLNTQPPSGPTNQGSARLQPGFLWIELLSSDMQEDSHLLMMIISTEEKQRMRS